MATKNTAKKQPAKKQPAKVADRRQPLIESVKLRNFKCFQETELPFVYESNREAKALSGKWTCIGGINGSGKSAVLQALALAMVGASRVLELGGRRLERLRRLVDGRREVEAEISIRLRFGEGTPSVATRGVILREGDPRWIPRNHSFNPVPIIAGYGANRSISDVIQRRETVSAPIQRVQTLFDPLAPLASADLLSEQSRQGDAVPITKELIEGVFQGQLSVHWDKARSQLMFQLGRTSLAAADLPDGFRSSAPWLADLCHQWMMREPGTTDLKTVAAIVLVDEIDQHLHPSLQRVFVPRLREALPNVQWIVTTHSPLILGCFDKQEIIILNEHAPNRYLQPDRQILGFSPDEIYEVMMETKAGSGAWDELVKNADTKDAKAELARLALASPTKDDEAAKQQVDDVLDRLKDIEEP